MNGKDLQELYNLDFVPTERQVEIVTTIRDNPNQGFIISAVAGAGKTTLAKILWRMWDDVENKMLLTFSRHLSHDLQAITGSKGNARTIHSMFTEIGNNFVNTARIGYDYRINSSKEEVRKGNRAAVEYAQPLTKVVNSKIFYTKVNQWESYLENLGIPFNKRTKSQLQSTVDLIRHKLLNYRNPAEVIAEFPEISPYIVDVACNIVKDLANHWYNTGEYDFTNLLWVPVQNRNYTFEKRGEKYLANFKEMAPRFDKMFIDEIQDASKLQRAAYGLVVHDKSQIVAVGDDKQTIMTFAGASIRAFEEFKEMYNLEQLNYNTTFRVPKCMVDYLNTSGLDARMSAFESNAEGNIQEGVTLQYMIDNIVPGDAVLARYNVSTKGLYNSTELLATMLIKNGHKVALIGRDNTATIRAVMIELKVWENNSLSTLAKKLDDYSEPDEDMEVVKVYLDFVMNKYNTLTWKVKDFIEAMERDVPSAIQQENFDGDDGFIFVMSAHRSKGKQYPRVWIFGFSEICASQTQEYEDVQGARNLAYVALTRAQHTIFLNETLPSEFNF